MKILILSFYYQPDLSACSFRTMALVKALKEILPHGDQVDVVTTLPNRYSTYSIEAPIHETQAGIEIHRIKLPSHKSGMIDQSKAFIFFAINALLYIRSRQYDLIYATSSRLMTASLGAWIAKQQKAKLYLDIRDIFVDTISEVLPRKSALLTKPVFSLIERYTFNQADKINLVSLGFKPYFDARYPSKDYSFFTNGIDKEFIEAGLKVSSSTRPAMPLKILCAGNIGEGQGLHAIVPTLARSMSDRVCFKLIGDGGRKAALQSAIEKAGVNNVEILPPVDRDQLIKEYASADVLFLHLNDYKAFEKVLPSKLFEYAAMGKPIWAGVSGYAAEFIMAEISNAVVFKPCDATEAEQVFGKLSIVDEVRQEFLVKYSRVNIMRAMADDIVTLMRGSV